MPNNSIATSLLSKINSPYDLKKLNTTDLQKICAELRDFYIEVVSKTGGHFAAGLGVVELSVALHYIFDSANDRIIWDVGHQAYIHKILTGRKNQIESLRTLGGISGFPKMAESEHDAFGTGHASTSISAALGMAVASQIQGNHLKTHIAVIGDGALTGGLAFEGLNNAGVSNANLMIILNDNSISIDPAVGALSVNFESNNDFIAKNTTRGIADGRTKRPKNASYFKEKGLKATNLSPKHFFESLNIPYHGPIDGHDLNSLLEHLKNLKADKGPRILHIKTTKGKGYAQAEENQVTWHSPGKFDKVTGEIFKPAKTEIQPIKYQEVFGRTLVELASANSNIVGITPAMPSGSSLNIFMEAFPERAFDVGIAEEHAVTFAAGLAAQGLLPYCTIYSTFLQRAFDQVIHDVCLQKLKVVFCIDRAGLVGEDGPTHHGMFDIAFLRTVPNLMIASPKDEVELRDLMYTAQLEEINLPFAIRYPRGNGELLEWQKPFSKIEIGKAELIKQGTQIAVLALGNKVASSQKAIESLNKNITLVNMRFVKPLDTSMLQMISESHETIVTIEDSAVLGGFGSAVTECLTMLHYPGKIVRLGFPDEFIAHGKVSELNEIYNLDANGIAKTLKSLI